MKTYRQFICWATEESHGNHHSGLNSSSSSPDPSQSFDCVPSCQYEIFPRWKTVLPLESREQVHFRSVKISFQKEDILNQGLYSAFVVSLFIFLFVSDFSNMVTSDVKGQPFKKLCALRVQKFFSLKLLIIVPNSICRYLSYHH